MKRSRGFTLIELLVVISIIALLSSVTLTGLNSARAKARDAKRLSDLAQLRTAMFLYYDKCETYIVKQNCTGTAYGSSGVGWFNYASYASSAGSVAQGLIDEGATNILFIDPSGMITTNNVNRSGYMVQATNVNFTLWANLENPTAEQRATQDNCKMSGYDNYQVTSPLESRMNYCVSN